MEFLLGIVILILDIWAIYSVLTSGVSTVSKLLWTIGILVFPVVGFIVLVDFSALIAPSVASRLGSKRGSPMRPMSVHPPPSSVMSQYA